MGDKHKTNFDIKNSTIEGSLISGGAKADGDIVGRAKNIFQQIISSRLIWVIIVLLAFIGAGVWSNQDLPLVTPLNRYLNSLIHQSWNSP